MDLDAIVKDALKVKIQEIFDEILVTTAMEGKDIVIRISLPDEMMKITYGTGRTNEEAEHNLKYRPQTGMVKKNHLDKEAQAAADELLGNVPMEEE